MPDIVQLPEDVYLGCLDLVRVVKMVLTSSATLPGSTLEKI
ncbi:MAG: hypothetical protein WCH20_00760 [Nitrospira sp.]